MDTWGLGGMEWYGVVWMQSKDAAADKKYDQTKTSVRGIPPTKTQARLE